MALGKEALIPGNYYHIFNHAVGNELLFRENRNYHFFLEKIEKWITPVGNLLAYCLMPNHFHLLLQIRSTEELEKLFELKLLNKLKLTKEESLVTNQMKSAKREKMILKLISEQFSHCFNSYVQAYNKTYKRMGALLKEGFQRKRIDSDEYLKEVICYIHCNPVKDRFSLQPEQWQHSSYNSILNTELKSVINICSSDVISLFENKINFVFVHENYLRKFNESG